jgi:hypothetical protein
MTSPAVVPTGSYDYYMSSDTFNSDIRFTDDMALKSFEITVRYRQDLAYTYGKTTNDPWNETFYGQISGNAAAFNEKIVIPFDPDAGPYEFRVKVWDESDNMTELSTFLFVNNTKDLVPPTIRFTAPDTNVVDSFIIGANIPIRAQIFDPPGLGLVDQVNVLIARDLSNEQLPGSQMEWDSVWIGWTLDTMYTIPAGTPPGDYNIHVFAKDFIQNVRLNSDRVYIKPF